jgi:hypothetical protein
MSHLNVGLQVALLLPSEHLDVAGHLLPAAAFARARLDVPRDELVAPCAPPQRVSDREEASEKPAQRGKKKADKLRSFCLNSPYILPSSERTILRRPQGGYKASASSNASSMSGDQIPSPSSMLAGAASERDKSQNTKFCVSVSLFAQKLTLIVTS